jgi:hypothetical protein
MKPTIGHYECNLKNNYDPNLICTKIGANMNLVLITLVLCEGVKVHDKCKQTEGNFSPFINVCV